MKFEFINDNQFREILQRDYAELSKCIESKSSKSVLILSGSIIEAILTDYFLNFPPEDLKEKKVLEMDLYKLIELAEENRLISKSTKDLSTVLKNYRNQIHPGREVRKQENFDIDTALVAKSLLHIIVKEIRENYLNNIGYSANDLLQKLQYDAISQTIFEKLLTKVHKTEKAKLFDMLIECELNLSPATPNLKYAKRYIRILKTQIEREIVEKHLKKIIHKIETSERWEVITYYDLLYEDLNYLEKDETELIILYMLAAFTDLAHDEEEIQRFGDLKLFSTFGTHLNTDAIKKEFLNLICALIKNFEHKDYVYFTAYDQLINSISTEKKEKVKDYVVSTLSSYYYNKFYEGYDDGNFLPF